MGLSTGPNSFLSWSSSDTAYVTINQAGLASWVNGTAGGQTVYISASALGDVMGTVSMQAKSAALVGLISATVDTFQQAIVAGGAWNSVKGGPWAPVNGNGAYRAASGVRPECYSTPGNTYCAVSGPLNTVLTGTTANFACAVIFQFGNTRTGVGQFAGAGNNRGNGGAWIYNRQDTNADFQGGGGTITTTSGKLVSGTLCCMIWGQSGTQGFIKINNGAIQTATRPNSTTSNVAPAFAGGLGLANGDYNEGFWYEFYAENITGTDSIANIVSSIYTRASSSLSGALP